MSYVIQLTTPEGKIEFIPERFGHGVHEHTSEIENAARFETREKAEQRLQAYINPPSFWGSERAHAEKMREKFKRWNCGVIELKDFKQSSHLARIVGKIEAAQDEINEYLKTYPDDESTREALGFLRQAELLTTE